MDASSAEDGIEHEGCGCDIVQGAGALLLSKQIFWELPFISRCSYESQDKLVDTQRDDSRGDGAKHMGHQASIKTRHTFFLGNELEALQQAGVFGDAVLHWRLTESCSDDLWHRKDRSVRL